MPDDRPIGHPPPLPPLTTGDHLDALAARGRAGTGAADTTYAELALDVERVACGLLALDLEPGDHLAILAPRSASWTLVQLAAARTGLVLVILDGPWTPPELAEAVTRLGPRVLVTTAAGSATVPPTLRRPTGPLEHVVALDGGAAETTDDLGWSELLVSGSAIDARLLVELGARLDPADRVAVEVRPGDAADRVLTHRDYLGPSTSST